jgi:hypothetical protein
MGDAVGFMRTWAERDAVPKSVEFSDEASAGAGAATLELAAAAVDCAVLGHGPVGDQDRMCDGFKCAVTDQRIHTLVAGNKVGVLAGPTSFLLVDAEPTDVVASYVMNPGGRALQEQFSSGFGAPG